MTELQAPWQVKVLTLFPEMFPGPLGTALAGKGLQNQLWQLEAHNIRDFAEGVHQTVDDTPYGGGPGMVMKPDVLDRAICAHRQKGERLVYLSPRGKVFDQAMARQFVSEPSVMFLCGRYEGIDERVIEEHGAEEVSIGDFILSGGEIAVHCMLDACVRLIPGVMGKQASGEEESFEGNLLEYPHYTRPSVWKGRAVPEVLRSGDHKKIADWRRKQSELLTSQRRPDLWERYQRTI